MILWHWFFSYFHLTLRRGSVVPRGKERENKIVFCLRGSCLSFCKGCLFPFAIWKMQGYLRGKSRSHFLIALINPACSKGERTEETARFAFLLPPSRSFSTVAFLFHCRLRFPLSPSFSGRQSTITLEFSHPLLVWNIVGGFCMSVSFMFNNRFFVCFLWLPVWMCCLFYIEESYIGVLFGCWFASVPRCRSRLCALFMLGVYACMQKNGLLLCSGFLVSMFFSFTDGNNILITERSWWAFCS